MARVLDPNNAKFIAVMGTLAEFFMDVVKEAENVCDFYYGQKPFDRLDRALDRLKEEIIQ